MRLLCSANRLLPVLNRNAMGGWLLLTLALMILVLPIQWVLAAILAALFHELCHYVTVRLCGGSVCCVHAGVFGARMQVQGLTVKGEFMSALAGPLGSLLLLFFAKWLPRTAVCAGFQGLYNLLPVYPMDGGRVLRCGAKLLFPPGIAEKLCKFMEWICVVALICLGTYGTIFKGLGILPFILAVSIVLRATAGKNTLQTGRVFGTIE